MRLNHALPPAACRLPPAPERRASHELIFTFAKQVRGSCLAALNIAKRLLDYNQHALPSTSCCWCPSTSSSSDYDLKRGTKLVRISGYSGVRPYAKMERLKLWLAIDEQ